MMSHSFSPAYFSDQRNNTTLGPSANCYSNCHLATVSDLGVINSTSTSGSCSKLTKMFPEKNIATQQGCQLLKKKGGINILFQTQLRALMYFKEVLTDYETVSI